MVHDEDDWLTIGQVCDLLQARHGQVRRWAESGLLPSDRTPGGHRRWSRSTVARFVRPVTATAEAEDRLTAFVRRVAVEAVREYLDAKEAE